MDEPRETLDGLPWEETIIPEECFRLDAAPEGEGPWLYATTLWEELCLRSFTRGASRQSVEAYVTLCRHGYEAYWAWMAEHERAAGAPWAFYIDNKGDPAYRCQRYALEHVDAVLACLRALPDACGAARVWEALAAVPQIGEDG
jgi:hypothetical protein